ncbi:hypothetical protein H17ap60334_01791 [Thermosipho africanus H17ap60334]|uniref:hypothetical protein n=1 Tax=Thermosipho TaxID=2420 RepID=UPI00028C4205|nr:MULTISPECIES: hypothetical protein [Thermosipho]EKF50102.1 hypothetical protein H17ap60334_01791 [Thermosipho africanus H17ap60334]MBZ4650882.1 hypothetical protein [Thermosipho sp. (in: thermotogales)]MDK2900806.1 hypothetical protein [Thermosipho sp. (in: thermotogales)]RDI90239.1 hypothetical protein Ob7_09042 [Thermosipho africanus Ob7]
MIDMQLFMTKEGDICSVEGWWHPEDKVICNYIYIQQPDGDIEIENRKYVKVIRKKDGSWRSFEEQLEYIKKLGRKHTKAYFVEHKMLVDKSNIEKFYDPFYTFDKFSNNYPQEFYYLEEFLKLLGVSKEEYSEIGMVGSYQVGLRKEKSDIDVLFRFNLKRNMEIFEKIIGLSSKKGMEVFDRGKKTPLRVYFRDKIFCCHFAYENTEDIPKIFSIDYRNLGAVNYKVEIIDNTHSIYAPTIVLGRILSTDEKMNIVIYHGGNKGEYNVGDILNVKGELIENNLGKFLNAKNVEKLKD